MADTTTAPRSTGAVWTAAGIAAVAAAVLAWLGGGTRAIERPLWLDEIVTRLIADAPRGVLHAMRTGADFQPPPQYFLVRLADHALGAADVASARMPSLIAAMLAVIVVAAALRTALSLPASIGGALILAAHPLFTGQVFEARPYALWILAAALMAMAVSFKRGRVLALVLASVLLCTVHYFGILALACLCTGLGVYGVAVERRAMGEVFRELLPAAAGGLALAALFPLAREQLAATGGESWMTAPSSAQIGAFLRFPWGWRPALYIVAAGIVATMVARIPAFARHADQLRINRSIVALLATALLPLLIVVLTEAYKPVMALRYAAPAVLAVAALGAIAIEALPGKLRWVAAVYLAWPVFVAYTGLARGADADIAYGAREVAAVRALAALHIPTVSPTRHDAYRITALTGSDPRVTWLDPSDSIIAKVGMLNAGGALSPASLRVERGFGRAIRAEFDFPRVQTVEETRDLQVVALLRDPDLAVADSIWLPGRNRCDISDRLVVFSTGTADASACAELQRRIKSASAGSPRARSTSR